MLFALALGLVALACRASPGATGSLGPSGSPAGPLVPVTKVTDGDTIHVEYRGRDERVRLIGVDTPEVDWYGGTAQCFGSQAGLYTRSRLDGTSVRLGFDVNLRDRYDRMLAYVWTGSELFNLTLVRKGYARADPVAPDTRLAPLFAEAEAQARSVGAGLWSSCPSPP